MASITLTAGMRSNLSSLQSTVDLLNRTQKRLGTGLKVNSALDNPISYFAAKAHMNRANDISSLKDGMGEAIQTIKATDAGLESITSLIEQAKALGTSALGAAKNQVKITVGTVVDGNVVTIGTTAYTAVSSNATASTFIRSDDAATTASNLAAKINAGIEGGGDMIATASGTNLVLEMKASTVALTQTTNVVSMAITMVFQENTAGSKIFSERDALADSYNDIITQIDSIVNSSGYKGKNLLMDDDLNVNFEGTSLNVKGFNAAATDLKMSTTATTASGSSLAWAVNKDVQTDMGKLDNAVSTLRSEASKLANNLAIINTQLDFSGKMVSTLTEGADKLTLADMNEEGANMLALQTKQALGATALSLSAQAAQTVLRLF